MTQTDLLSYLVTSQLAARMRSGAWLTTGQLVDVERMWLACRHAELGEVGLRPFARLSVIAAVEPVECYGHGVIPG